ncbi:glucoamylase family protein [Flaviaesturariibacter amylovorans]|uniref:glucoamylase family protein n=1 Tax=Flaviaesturariibacter amylovorans TaxID=1084520 RepID=UPI0031E79C98
MHNKQTRPALFGMLLLAAALGSGLACAKRVKDLQRAPAASGGLSIVQQQLNDRPVSTAPVQLTANVAVLRLRFSDKVDRSTVGAALSWKATATSSDVPVGVGYADGDSTLILTPGTPLAYLSGYSVRLSNRLRAAGSGMPASAFTLSIRTGIDPADKFPVIPDEALLDSVQKRTFRYFWDYGHPLSGLARDKTQTTDLDDCSVGGTGFGILCLPVAVHRGLITREAALARLRKIVDFLTVKAQRYHGAFPHRINGTTGATIVWHPKDDGADLVETSFLMMGLLTARQFFDGAGDAEGALRSGINTLFREVNWQRFRKDDEQALYWLWSPNHGWDISFRVRGWNETLITYILAAASPTHGIGKEAYDHGFADRGALRNGQQFYGMTLPLGPAFGGPLFLSQYSFLALNPIGLKDTYADYEVQARNHALINRAYCIENPKSYLGYSDSGWGLTASSTHAGYTPCSPTSDVGVIAPTAALASFGVTPHESLAALRYFYYRLGDRLWKDYGFVDAFNLNTDPVWIAPQELVYNQLPVMIAIENHRSGLVWRLFTSCPEVKAALRRLGFTAPYL